MCIANVSGEQRLHKLLNFTGRRTREFRYASWGIFVNVGEKSGPYALASRFSISRQ